MTRALRRWVLLVNRERERVAEGGYPRALQEASLLTSLKHIVCLRSNLFSSARKKTGSEKDVSLSMTVEGEGRLGNGIGHRLLLPRPWFRVSREKIRGCNKFAGEL